MNIEDLTINQQAPDIAAGMIGKYCLIRTYSAGVHAGILAERSGREVLLTDSRRIWYWNGAASLSQLAKSGTSLPNKCKFAVPIQEILLTECIELITCTNVAERNIREVPEWTR